MKHDKQKKKLAKRIIRITAIVLTVIIVLPLITIYSIRGVNAIRFNIRDGVQERIFVNLGGIEQAIHIRGQSINNPVIIWLHGGPGWSDTYNLSTFQFQMEHEFTFVRWDQRGTGRTFYKNPDAPLSLDIQVSDLDDLVEYVTDRFNQPVFIVGHSWGSVLGITYASRYPEKIAGFVGVGQNINFAENTTILINAGIERALTAGNTADAEQMRALYERVGGRGFSYENFDFADIQLLQGLPGRYLTPSGESIVLDSMFSPWFGFTEKRQLISLIADINFNFNRNRPLFNELDIFTPPEQLEIPIAFIMGREDYITSTSLVIEYYNRVEAPSRNIFIIEGAGHNPMVSQPNEFAKRLREALNGFIMHHD